ncbi:MAG: lysophospholipid acyltransferase family protein [Ilumatobacteraceae bacterium]
MRDRLRQWSLAPDGRPRPDAPFGRGPIAARVLARVIDAAAFAGSRVPVSVAHALAVIGGHTEWALRSRKRAVLATNLGHAVGAHPRTPIVRRLVRREVVNEARRSADLLWATGRPDEFVATTAVTGDEHTRAALESGRGVVLAGVHLGGWELAVGLPAALFGVPSTVVVADDWLAWAMQHVRSRAGLNMTAPSAALSAARALRRGEIAIVFGDDARAGPRRHEVPFCDSTASLPAGTVALAQMTGAVLVPFAVVPLGPRRWHAVLDHPIEPPARGAGEDEIVGVLTDLTARWSAFITAHPEHWAAVFPIDWGAGA